jgi:ferredoxin-NADP reductase
MGEIGYQVALAGSVAPCAGTGSFSFTRPAGYHFEPGQYLTLTLQTRDGEVTKQFSHCDAPGDAHTQILTRMTGSAFKDALAALAVGDVVTMHGPFGRLVVPEGARKVAFLVGGVGITPMLSIVRDSVRRSTGLTVLVFDGNLDDSCIPLREEFEVWEREQPSVRFVHVLEHPSDGWTGERGFITAETVTRHCDPLDGWHWFVAGPPAMADAMRGVLTRLGVPETAFSFESFAGYR